MKAKKIKAESKKEIVAEIPEVKETKQSVPMVRIDWAGEIREVPASEAQFFVKRYGATIVND